MITDSTQPILIVEDSDDDFEATSRALNRDGNLANPIIRFDDGAKALDYLFRKPPYDEDGAAPTPGLVLLDLNLPGLDGRAVLKLMKSDTATREIPVVILTTSKDEWDISHCYRAGANTYVQKPVQFEAFIEAIRSLKNYWFQVALLPKVK